MKALSSASLGEDLGLFWPCLYAISHSEAVWLAGLTSYGFLYYRQGYYTLPSSDHSEKIEFYRYQYATQKAASSSEAQVFRVF